MPLGQTTTLALTRVSTREELLREANVSGLGAPAHTPQIPYQRYYDLDGDAAHEWYAGVWHSL